METKIIDGRKLRDSILEKVKAEISSLKFQPVFCDILIGDNSVSAQYVNMKAKTAEAVGIHFHHANFSEDISTESLVEEIKKLNQLENICGLIVQLPIPKSLDTKKVLDSVDSKIDVDCLGEKTSEVFYEGENVPSFPTALACMAILDSINVDDNPSTSLRTRKIVVIGQGKLVGLPVTYLLNRRGLKVETVTRSTLNKEEIIKNADVIISATGQGKFLQGNMIKQGAIIIDAGTSESNGGIVGDVDLESVTGVAGYVSPVPGGVGPVTVAMLLNNVLTVAKNKYE